MSTQESVQALRTAVVDHSVVLVPAALLAVALALLAVLARTQGLSQLQASAHRSRWLAQGLAWQAQQLALALVLPVRTDRWS